MSSDVERINALRDLAAEVAKAHPFLSNPAQAAGLCFWSALVFAELAAHFGYPVELIRWEVYDWGPYRDHWAVVLNGNQLIDLTRSQVDGRTSLFWRTTDYPDNYFCARRYPAALFLTEYLRVKGDGWTQFPQAFMNSVLVARAKFDASRFQPTTKVQLFGMTAMAVAFYAFCAWRIFA